MHSEDELLFLWMTHRFVEPKSNVNIESSAREYLETLIIHSFLQKSEYEKQGFVMHDIVHDFCDALLSSITNPLLSYSDFCKKERMIKVSKYSLALLSMSTFDFGSTNLCAIYKNNNSSSECIQPFVKTAQHEKHRLIDEGKP